jgi:hypothetical protein
MQWAYLCNDEKKLAVEAVSGLAWFLAVALPLAIIFWRAAL